MPRFLNRTAARRHLALPFAFVTLVAATGAATAGTRGVPVIRSVGSGIDCDHSSLSTALSLAKAESGDDVLRIVDDLSNVQLTLSDFDPSVSGGVTLQGGYPDCATANDFWAGPTGSTTLSGGGSGPVLTIASGGALDSFVRLQDLRIMGATAGRGVVIEGGSTEVLLLRSEVTGNAGGIEVVNGAQLYVDSAVRIHDNDAGSGLGGGIYCHGAGAILEMLGTVEMNTAAFGGGLAVENTCSATLFDGARVVNNDGNFGGGLFVATSGSVNGGGAGPEGVVISGNEAAFAGGGVSVTNPGSSVTLPNTHIVNNTAQLTGGGVHASNSAFFRTERFNFEPCATPPRCAVVSGNELLTGSDGSAIYASTGAEVRFYQGYLDHNRGQLVPASAIFATDLGTQVIVEGLQLFGNVTPGLFEAHDHAVLTAGFISAAENLADESGVGQPSLGAVVDTNASVEIYSSSLPEVLGFTTESAGTARIDCSIVAGVTGVTQSNDNLFGIDPLYRDPVGGDLRLLDGSPAVDRCDTTFYSPIDSDAELHLRGFDDPTPNLLGPYDMGFDESRDRAIFADRFEGGLSRWSSTVG